MGRLNGAANGQLPRDEDPIQRKAKAQIGDNQQPRDQVVVNGFNESRNEPIDERNEKIEEEQDVRD